ncbi:MAG: hypothetical protein KY460_08385 [Actinobacteria bacterium]|nr:hypothetical protein [Actinomycetota bacterium]
MTRTHLIGLLLGTEDDWPTAFEQYLRRLDLRIPHEEQTHTFDSERITIEPFSLRQPARHDFVVDRLAYWYYHPREWLKKVALVDDVYLPNNPFTFQSMEKHAAFCAAIRMGFEVPETWLLPHKVPPDNERFAPTARRYNRIFDIGRVGDEVGYPMYMKPFHGGGWVNVTRIGDAGELRDAFDQSGRELMHVQAGVEGYDTFARGLQIGAETMVLSYDPTRPLHERYNIDHDFLTPDMGYEIETFGRTIGAFFRWELNSFEVIVRDGVAYPIDFANACPDMAIISLHYYFPWAIKTLVKWAVYCSTTGRRMRLDGQIHDFYRIADDADRSYRDKLDAYRALTDEYLERERYEEFCATHLRHVDEAMADYITSAEFDDHLVGTIVAAFPAHEHEGFVARYRGLLGAWASDQQARAVG